MSSGQKVGQADHLSYNGFAELPTTWEKETRLLSGQGYGVTREKRGNGGNRYYYTSERINDRVVKKYLGCSSFGLVMAGSIIGRKIEERQVQAKAAAMGKQSDAFFVALDALGRRSTRLVALCMEAAAYHRHKRGPWRKKRATVTTVTHKKEGLLMVDLEAQAVTEASLRAVADTDIVNAALLDPNSPLRDKAIEILRGSRCDIGTHLADDIHGFIMGFTDGGAVMKEIYLNQYRSVWREMTGTTHGSSEARKIPAVERILIDRVIVCRFALVHFQGVAGKATSYRAAEQAERDIDRAQRRLLLAVKCLAEVKRLGIPMVNVAMPGATQINLGENQVNVEGFPCG